MASSGKDATYRAIRLDLRTLHTHTTPEDLVRELSRKGFDRNAAFPKPRFDVRFGRPGTWSGRFAFGLVFKPGRLTYDEDTTMELRLLRAKLHMATVTGTNLAYHGSITIPRDLMDEAGFLPWEAVTVANCNSGQRGETYIIEGPAGSGEVELNGAIARMAEPGDRVIVLSFASMKPSEAIGFEPRVVILDEKNHVTEKIGAVADFLN